MGLKERSKARRKRIVGNIAHSHEEAERWDLEFWLAQSPQQRLSALIDIHEDIAKVGAAGKRRLEPERRDDEDQS